MHGYSADLFAKIGVELPHDGMTWQDMMNTARRFPAEGQGEDRIYGFVLGHVTSFSELALLIGSFQGLTMNRPETGELTLNSEGWKQAYRTALDGIESGAVFDVDNGGAFSIAGDYYAGNPFLLGRAAMTTGGSHMFQDMKEAETSAGYKPFKSGAVAGPVNPAEPDKTDDMDVHSIFAIRAGSPNADAAWEFIKFANGEKLAKEQYQRILSRELELVCKGSKSVDDALDTVQSEAQAAGDLARKAQEEKVEKQRGR